LEAVGNMATMQRLLLLSVLAISCLVAFPVAADAKVPCRNAIFNDWYHDGQIASTYPLACYRDALAHVRNGDTIYTSLKDDIRSALQAAIQRGEGKTVAEQIGHGLKTPSTKPVLVNQDGGKTSAKTIEAVSPRPGDNTQAAPSATLADSSTSSGGVPLPILVLGAIALALVAAGGLGLVVRRRRGTAG
jgi:hypothetical protein